MELEDIINLEKKIKEGYRVSQDEAFSIVNIAEKQEIYKLANRLREHFCGDYFDTCSIINAKSGRCSEDCKWCSQSKFHNCNITTYPLVSEKECLEMATNNHNKGVRRFSLVTSGRTLSDSEVQKAAKIYSALSKGNSIKLCASMGLLAKEQLELLYKSGVSRYHCNLESAPSMFSRLCTTHTIEDKLATIKAAREVGMKICSGGIIGMGESMAQRIEFALLLRKVAPDSIPLNILNPIKGTALEHTQPLSQEEILVSLAMFRIVNPEASIRFAGGRGALSPQGQITALQCGINGAIVGDLLTTIGDKDIEADRKMFEKYYTNF